MGEGEEYISGLLWRIEHRKWSGRGGSWKFRGSLSHHSLRTLFFVHLIGENEKVNKNVRMLQFIDGCDEYQEEFSNSLLILDIYKNIFIAG